MALKFTTTNQAAQLHGVKALVYGPSGAGKTTLCATAPAPIIISAEAGLLSLLLFGLIGWLKGEAATAVIALVGSGMLLWMAAGMAAEARTIRFRTEDEGGPGAPPSGGGQHRGGGSTTSLAGLRRPPGQRCQPKHH